MPPEKWEGTAPIHLVRQTIPILYWDGNNCDLLTITSFACDPEALRARKGVVVSARVHPGESNASHMMKGVIDYLTVNDFFFGFILFHIIVFFFFQ